MELKFNFHGHNCEIERRPQKAHQTLWVMKKWLTFFEHISTIGHTLLESFRLHRSWKGKRIASDIHEKWSSRASLYLIYFRLRISSHTPNSSLEWWKAQSSGVDGPRQGFGTDWA